MSSATVPWDRLAEAIRARLPEWARYRARWSTLALACYVYSLFGGAAALGIFLAGNTTWATIGGVAAVILYVFAGYFEDGAKRRLSCSQCRYKARGKSVCPACGELTYVEGV